MSGENLACDCELLEEALDVLFNSSNLEEINEAIFLLESLPKNLLDKETLDKIEEFGRINETIEKYDFREYFYEELMDYDEQEKYDYMLY